MLFDGNIKENPRCRPNGYDMIDYDKLCDIEVEDVNASDYPDFCDAYISYASYKERPLTDEELALLNEDSDFIHEKVLEELF